MDCPEDERNSGVCKELGFDDEKERALVECLHCGRKGYLPKGTPFRAEVCIEDAAGDARIHRLGSGPVG